jgi:hypothetical protein
MSAVMHVALEIVHTELITKITNLFQKEILVRVGGWVGGWVETDLISSPHQIFSINLMASTNLISSTI